MNSEPFTEAQRIQWEQHLAHTAHNILDLKIKLGGGHIAGPQGLGLIVGDDPLKVPAGWIFVDVNNPPPNTEVILAALAAGRNTWPEPEVMPKPEVKRKQ